MAVEKCEDCGGVVHPWKCESCRYEIARSERMPFGLMRGLGGGAYSFQKHCWDCWDSGRALIWSAGPVNMYPRSFPENPWKPQSIRGLQAREVTTARGLDRRTVNFARKRFSVSVVRSVLARQDYLCNNCLDMFDFTRVRYVIDHMEPLCRGGLDELRNFQALCGQCHLPKGTMSLAEWNVIKARVARLSQAMRAFCLDYSPLVWADRKARVRRKWNLFEESDYERSMEVWRHRPLVLRRESLEKSLVDERENAVQEGLFCADAASGISGVGCPYLAIDAGQSEWDKESFLNGCIYKPDARFFLRALA